MIQRFFRLVSLEVIQQIRERQWLFMTLLLPILLIPLTMLGTPFLIGKISSLQVSTEIAFSGDAQNIITRSLQKKGVILNGVDNAQKAVYTRKFPLGLHIDLASKSKSKTQIYLRPSDLRSLVLQRRILDLIKETEIEYTAKRLEKYEKKSNFFKSEVISTETESETAAGLLIFIIPIILINALFDQAQTIGFESTASAKERGELECNFVSPFPKTYLIAVKIISTLSISTFLVLETLLVTALITFFRSSGMININKTALVNFGSGEVFNIGRFLQILMLCVSVGLLFSTILIMVGYLSKSYKAAKSIVEPVSMVLIVSTTLFQFVDFIDRNLIVYAIPVIGTIIGLLDGLKGFLEVKDAATIISVNLLLAFLIFAIGQRLISSERVLKS
jgi:sodium transport system permease protein